MNSNITAKMLRHHAIRTTRTFPSLLSTQSRAFATVQLTKSPDARTVTRGPTQMTGSEAFVETLVSHGVTDVFGIVGSAFMDALDLFPEAGIRFIPTQHEQNSVHMADGYARISGKHGVCVAQNGPGITNFVTGIAAGLMTLFFLLFRSCFLSMISIIMKPLNPKKSVSVHTQIRYLFHSKFNDKNQ